MDMLKTLRRQLGISQKELGARLGVSRGAVAMWESGRSTPDADMLVHLADVFGTTVDTLLGSSDNTRGCRFPIVSAIVSAGPGLAPKEILSGQSVDVPATWLGGTPAEEFLVLRACGASMWPDILDGDLLLVRRSITVENDRVALVLVGSKSATVRRLQYSPGGGYVDLIPRNPEYPPQRIQGEDLQTLQILGAVKTIIRNLP